MSKEVELQHGAPKELWDLEMELSNICAYSSRMTESQLARRFVEIKTKVRDMIREYGFTGPF